MAKALQIVKEKAPRVQAVAAAMEQVQAAMEQLYKTLVAARTAKPLVMLEESEHNPPLLAGAPSAVRPQPSKSKVEVQPSNLQVVTRQPHTQAAAVATEQPFARAATAEMALQTVELLAAMRAIQR